MPLGWRRRQPVAVLVVIAGAAIGIFIADVPGLTGSGLIESPAKALEMWTLELEAMHRLGAAFVLCCHPFLSGRPSRAEALGRLIERMKSLDGLWITTVGEVATSLPATPADASSTAFEPDPIRTW